MHDADRLSPPPSSGREARSARQRDALVQLAGLFHVRDGDVGLFRTLTEVVAVTLPVSSSLR